MKKHLLLATLLLTIITIFTTCKKDVPIPPFDKQAMLENWADNLIIPAQRAYNKTTKTLQTQAQAFVNDPTLASLEAVRTAWSESYIAWQHVPFNTPYTRYVEDSYSAGDLVFLYSYSNIYPTDSAQIGEFIDSQDLDANSVVLRAQGLPALEYMLYGLVNTKTDSDILAHYQGNALNSEKHKQYLLFLTNRLQSVSNAALHKWINGFRDILVKNIDTSPEFPPRIACAKKVIIDYIYYYKIEMLYSKVGIPSGACMYCEGKTFKDHIEGSRSRFLSKTLLLEALNATQDFYNGVPFGGSFEERSNSMYQYLDYLGTQKEGKKLCALINEQFDKTRAEIDKLDDDLVSEIENRPELMISVYEQLEGNRILLEEDMLDAMDIAHNSSSECF